MTVLSSILFFSLGVLVGSLTTYVLMKTNFKLNEYWIAGLVTVLWAVSVVVELSVPEYVVPTAVHGLMGVIAGHFFYEKRFKK